LLVIAAGDERRLDHQPASFVQGCHRHAKRSEPGLLGGQGPGLLGPSLLRHGQSPGGQIAEFAPAVINLHDPATSPGR
jgi:hypothetical protein